MVQRIFPYADQLELPTSIRIHRVQPLSLLDLVVNGPSAREQDDPPPPVKVDGEEEHQVSGVGDGQMYQNQLHYLVHWTGYDSLRWEPTKFADGLQVVREFHQRYPKKPGPLEDVLRGPRT